MKTRWFRWVGIVGVIFVALAGARAQQPAKAPDIYATVKTAVKEKKITETRIVGGGYYYAGAERRTDADFREVPAEGAVLVGFQVALDKRSGEAVRTVQPIFAKRLGDKFMGEKYGKQRTSSLYRIVKVEAKTGYAVGAITANASYDIRGFAVTFMKIQGDKLNPDDAYTSEWIGSKAGDQKDVLSGEGAPVVGICGKLSYSDEYCSGLGLMVVGEPEPPAPRPGQPKRSGVIVRPQ